MSINSNSRQSRRRQLTGDRCASLIWYGYQLNRVPYINFYMFGNILELELKEHLQFHRIDI